MRTFHAFEGPGTLKRMTPFVGVASLGLLSTILPPHSKGPELLVVAALLTVALVLSALLVPWGRFPRTLQSIPPLLFLIVVVLTRHAEGGAASDMTPLVAITVLWLALYGSRREVLIAVVGAGLVLTFPIVLLGPPSYPMESWRQAALWTALLAFVGPTIQTLVAARRRSALDSEEILRMVHRMVESNDSRQAAVDAAAFVGEASISMIFEPDRNGSLFVTASKGANFLGLTIKPGAETSGVATCYAEGRRVWVSDASRSTEVSQRLVTQYNVRSVLFEPLKADGKVIGVMSLGFRSRKKMNAQLLTSIEFIANEVSSALSRNDLFDQIDALVENATDVVMRVDNTKRLLFVSTSMQTLFGHVRDELVGTELNWLLHPSDRTGLDKFFAGLRPAETPATIEFRLRRSNGTYAWAEATAQPIVDKGVIKEVQFSVRDFTVRKHLQDELLFAYRRETEMVQEMQELATERQRFFAGITHDLRTPLTTIVANAELMGSSDFGQLNEAQAACLRRINKNSQRLLRLIEDLLTVQKDTLNQLIDPLEVVDVKGVLEDLVEQLRMQTDQKHIDVDCAIDRDVRADVFGDTDQLERAFSNLLNNAIKYTPTGGHIEVTCRNDPDQVLISIADSGIGIPIEDQGHVFTPLARASNARASNIGGTGLGLGITQQIIRDHSGVIELQSELGVGTTVTVSLPVSHG